MADDILESRDSSLEVVLVARCPEHGLHGQRLRCFECGVEAEQVPMLELHPTFAMHAGEAVIEECANCGVLVTWAPWPPERRRLGSCPNCAGLKWLRRRLPVGPFARLEPTPEQEHLFGGAGDAGSGVAGR